MIFVCGCKRPEPPYVNLGESYDGRWWVHSECGLPKEAWLRSLGDAMINFFRGGPLDGNAYATSTLLENKQLMVEYHWTPEVIVSAKTGATARVWAHSTLGSAITVEQPSSPAEDQDATQGKEGESIMSTSLRTRREDAKLSRSKVAEAAGLTPAKVYRIEEGGKRTTPEETKQLSDALDKLIGEAAPAAESDSGTEPEPAAGGDQPDPQ